MKKNPKSRYFNNKDKVKRLNEFFRLFVSKPADMDNKSFCKRHGFRQDEFYALRKRLVNLKRLDKKSLKMIKDNDVSLDEYHTMRYPYIHKKGGGKKKMAGRKNGKGGLEDNGIWLPRKEGKTASTEQGLLNEELTFPVKENDGISISLHDFTKVIIRLVREGHLK